MVDWRTEGEVTGETEMYLDPPAASAWCTHQLLCCIKTSISTVWDVHILRKPNVTYSMEIFNVLLTGECWYFHNTAVSTVTARSRAFYYKKRLPTVLRFDPFFLKCLATLPFIFPAKESFDQKIKRKWGWLEAKCFWRVIVYLCYTWNHISINFWRLSDIVRN